MSIVRLEILEPQLNARFAGSSTVRMHGRVVSTGHPALFFKWYSSLHAPTDVTKVALNGAADNPMDFSPALKVGSHIITFTAKDMAGDGKDDLTAVQNAGMAGGPAAAESPCIIHLFLANMVFPAAGATLSKANSKLEAEAPVKWGRKIEGAAGYERDPDYHNVNRIRYRWRFAPLGSPARYELIPTLDQLAFDAPSNAVPVVRYQGPLPAALDIGGCTLTLRVEDLNDSAVGHEVSRNVVIID